MTEKTIIVIDDDTFTCDALLKALGKTGYAVECYTNPVKALERLHADAPDLIVLDLMMPGDIDGSDVFRLMQKDKHLRTIPVIVFTNMDSPILEEFFRSRGTADYLTKSRTTLDQLIFRINEILQ